MIWKNIEINKQNIEFDNGKSTLIKMPNKSEYAGYKFWHPSKLVRSGSNSYALSVGYNDNFTFKLFKSGKGRYNSNQIVDEIMIEVSEFEEAFECMESCTRAKCNESYLIITEPNKLDLDVKIDENLKND